jgi:hypothetical protein
MPRRAGATLARQAARAVTGGHRRQIVMAWGLLERLKKFEHERVVDPQDA